MKKSTKAALLSTLVFPGVGHFYLKKFIIGVILAGCSLLCLYLIISITIENVLEIVNEVESGNLSADITTIAELISQQSPGEKYSFYIYLWPSLICLWLVAIFDSYRVGRLLEKIHQKA